LRGDVQFSCPVCHCGALAMPKKMQTAKTSDQSIDVLFLEGKNLIYTFKLSQKFDFQPSTIKPDNRDHPIVETMKILPLVWF